MKNVSLVLISLLLSSCVSSIKSLKADSLMVSDGFLVLDEEFTFDGDKHDQCFVGFDLKKSPKDIKIKGQDEESNFRLVSVPNGGKMFADGVNCIENKGLWAKARRKMFNPNLVVDVEPGTITYPGTIVADWESEGFGLLDVINLGGGLVEDEGSITMRREDKSDFIKSILESENPAILKKFKFKTKKFEDNPNLIQ